MSKRTKELMEWAGKYLLSVQLAAGAKPWAVMERGHGVWIQDTDGKEYIDTQSSGECCNLGHGRKEIIDAVQEQLSKLDVGTSWFFMSNEKVIEYARRLAEVTPEGLDHTIFTTGGAEAVDYALKMVHLYWFFQGKRKWKIISLFGAYHGMGAAKWASNRTMFPEERWGPETPGFLHIPHYHCYRCMFGLKYPDCNVWCARYLAEVIANERPETVAAFIAEPVIGGSGMIPPPPEYWPIVRRICDEYDVLLIYDEVMTGFTRTGKLFALEHWGVKPDILVIAKPIANGCVPFGGAVINDKVYRGLEGQGFGHGYTFSGHCVGAAAALAALNLYVGERVADNAAKVGKHILERLEAEFKSLPCVDNPTGLGMMIGFDVVANKTTKTPLPLAFRESLHREIFDKGLMNWRIWGYGDSRFFIFPPCIMTVQEADKMLDILLPIMAAIKPS